VSQYSPGTPPLDKDPELVNFLMEELRRISVAMDLILDIEKLNVAPDKPRDGMVRYADGTNWNPGAGAGLYIYKGSAWTLLG
jgi:hypothetical protein